MKIDILKKDFDTAIQSALRAVGKNLTLPLLSNILLKTEKNKFIIRSTNLTIGFECSLPIKNEENIETIIPGQTLANTISALPSEKITLSFEKGNLHLETKERKILIKGGQNEEFPTIPKVSGYSKKIHTKTFIDGFKGVYWAAASSDIKPEIASVYVYNQGDSLVFVATDSFRLAEKRIPVKNIQDFPTVLIPAKNVADIVRILENMENEVQVSVSKNQISFEGGGVYITSRVVDGIYPDYRQIIPKEETTSVTLLRADLIDTLRVSSLFSDKFGHMTLFIDPKSKVCAVTTVSDIGENTSQLAVSMEGEAVELHLNIKYLIEALSIIPDDSIVFSMTSATKPVVLRGVGNHSFLYLIMPMNR